MYELTTQKGRFKFVVDEQVVKVYEKQMLIDQGSVPLLSLIEKIQNYEEALKEIANTNSNNIYIRIAKKALEDNE